jgi:guanylate kinase
MDQKRLGMILVLSGASGTGKSTVCNRAMEKLGDIHFSISCTTREPRPGETDGISYYFIDKDDFKKRIENHEFIEYAEVHGNYYGTLKSEVLEKAMGGNDVVLDIDIQGALQIIEYLEHDDFLDNCCEFVFFGPPSYQELEKRLRGRGTETEEIITTRLNNAKKELEAWNKYDFLIINDDVEEAIDDFISLITTLRMKTKRLKDPGFYA